MITNSQKISISQRGKDFPASPIRKLVPFADKAKSEGVKVYHLNIGQPDFELPNQIKESLQLYSKEVNLLPYAPSQGIKEHLEAWQKFYGDKGIDLALKDILITAGGSEALILALSVLLDPGDEFLVFEPFYANYQSFATLLSLEIVPIELKAENNYHLPSIESITSKITSKTKAILMTNPNNPTGTVFEKDELLQILQIAKENNLYILADETYQGMSFGNKETTSFLSLSDIENRGFVVVVDSLSKKFNICGARLGSIVSFNQEVMESLNRLSQARLSVATIEQMIVNTMLTNGWSYVKDLAQKYENRRNLFLNELEKCLQVKVNYPEGAFYAMVKLPVADSDEFSQWLLTDFRDKNETVMVAPGSGFYATPGKGKDEIRVAFVLNENDLKRAAELLGLAVKEYSHH